MLLGDSTPRRAERWPYCWKGNVISWRRNFSMTTPSAGLSPTRS